MSDGSCFYAAVTRRATGNGRYTGRLPAIFPRNHRTDPKLFLMKRTFTLLGGRPRDDGRSPETLPPRPRRAGSQPRSAPHRIRGVRLARRGAHALLRAERRLPLARRRMEIPLCGRRPRPARRRDGRRRRHFGVERHPRSGQLGVAGTRHADLRQHALRIRHDRSRAAAPARGDSGRASTAAPSPFPKRGRDAGST